jgi:hypothetical protein
MNDFQNNYDPASFGQPQIQPKKRSGCVSSPLLIALGGCAAVSLLVCLCCIGGSFLVIREPIGAVVLWGAGAQSGWGISEYFVCEGSQAATVTEDFKTRNVVFSSTFNTVQDASDSNQVEVSSAYTEDGETVNWEATFTVKEAGGFFSNCIDRITVQNSR